MSTKGIRNILRFSAAFLTLLYLYTQCGYQLFFIAQQFRIKYNLNKEYLTSLSDQTFLRIQENKNIDWEERGVEMLINGEMYDVIKTKNINGINVYFVLNDKMENSLLKKNRYYFGDLPKKESSNDKTVVIQKIKQLVFIRTNPTRWEFNNVLFADYISVKEKKYKNFVSDTFTPPPKFA